jgi:hypothetical protein
MTDDKISTLVQTLPTTEAAVSPKARISRAAQATGLSKRKMVHRAPITA